MKYLLAIPIYNEENRIEKVVHETLKYNYNMDILLINDGSSDNTFSVIENLRKKFTFLKVIHRVKNQGYGSSMITSFGYAIQFGYDYLITMDCDEQHQPADIQRFLQMSTDIDVVSGSRYMQESNRSGHAPIDRVEINFRITKKINQLYDWNLTDSFCGFKRYRTRCLLGENFTELGYAFPLEFWAYSKAKGLYIQELAVDRIYITDDRSFGEDLDKKRKRYRYYLEVWKSVNQKYLNRHLNIV